MCRFKLDEVLVWGFKIVGKIFFDWFGKCVLCLRGIGIWCLELVYGLDFINDGVVIFGLFQEIMYCEVVVMGYGLWSKRMYVQIMEVWISDGLSCSVKV